MKLTSFQKEEEKKFREKYVKKEKLKQPLRGFSLELRRYVEEFNNERSMIPFSKVEQYPKKVLHPLGYRFKRGYPIYTEISSVITALFREKDDVNSLWWVSGGTKITRANPIQSEFPPTCYSETLTPLFEIFHMSDMAHLFKKGGYFLLSEAILQKLREGLKDLGMGDGEINKIVASFIVQETLF